ncbi:MAG TPA: hypothetical protein VN920_00740, partial [Pyrinomonadaceae bacterium]|nr:hypothetical protein [Pyrinomonadaceae bacterium]
VHELSRVTTSASIFGYTPNYAPLEQVQGLGTDPRSDLYALAATLYHLVTGTKPPDALTRAASIINGQTDPLQRADEVNPAVSPAFAGVLRRAMAQNRDQRYANAAEMRKALHAGSEATVALGSDAATMLFPPARTEVAAVINPTVPERATALASESTVVRDVQVPRTKSALRWTAAGAILVLVVAGAGAFYAFERRNKPSQTSQQPTPSPVISVQVAQPSPSASENKSNPASKANAEKGKAENTAREMKKQTAAKKKAKTDEQNAAAAAENAANDRSARSKDRAAAPPEVPPMPAEAADVPAPNGRGRRRFPNVRTQTKPDGTRVMITPNGTRVVTYPDGSTRVFGPGQRPRRRP